MKILSTALCAVGLTAAMSASAQITFGGGSPTAPLSDVTGLSSSPGTATYSATSAGGSPGITLSVLDNVGGGGFAQFQNTASITVQNGLDGVNLGTLNNFLSSGASFNLYSASAGGGQYAYWDIDLNVGGTIYQINAFGDNNTGANPFNSGQSVSASSGYSSGGSALPGLSFGELWTTLAGTDGYGADSVTAVTIDIGGWNTGDTQTDVINSITLPGTYVAPVPEASTLIAGALLLLPLGASTLRILRRRSIA